MQKLLRGAVFLLQDLFSKNKCPTIQTYFKNTYKSIVKTSLNYYFSKEIPEEKSRYWKYYR